MTDHEISRRQWLKSVAATVVTGSVAGSVMSSCQNEGDNWSQKRAESRGEDTNPFDAEEIVASLPGEVGCVECGRCMPCGFGVNIPAMYAIYNEAVASGDIPQSGSEFLTEAGINSSRKFVARIEREIGDKHLSHRCAGCGWCEGKCPKRLPIAQQMKSIGRFIDLTRETV